MRAWAARAVKRLRRHDTCDSEDLMAALTTTASSVDCCWRLGIQLRIPLVRRRPIRCLTVPATQRMGILMAPATAATLIVCLTVGIRTVAAPRNCRSAAVATAGVDCGRSRLR